MIRALFTAATGMHAQETNIDVIANNLANVNTVGFKKSRADFQDLMYQYVVEPGARTSESTKNPTGIQVGLGVKTAAVQKVFVQGDLISTGNQLDLAIEGDGFMKVSLPDGTSAYTRSGSLKLNENGVIVTSDGYELDPSITIDPTATSITVAQDGEVSFLVPGQEAPSVAGNLLGYRFPNNAGLRAIGQNLYQLTEASGNENGGTFSEEGFGRIIQGFLETSNVSIVEQVVSMITAQRAYEASSKGLQAADEMLTQAINAKR